MRRRAALFLVAFLYYGFPGLPAAARPPIDFCETQPASPFCNPEEPPPVDPSDPCVIDPGACEPEPEPTIVTFGTLHGSLRVSGPRAHAQHDGDLTIVATETGISMTHHGTCLALEGTHAAHPKKLNTYDIALDEDALATLGGLVASVAGDPSQTKLGASVRARARGTLKVLEDGTFLLKLRGGVRFEKVGRVGFQARYTGTVTNGPPPDSIPGCM